MTKIIYSFFVLSLLFSLYGCTGTNSSASQGVQRTGTAFDIILQSHLYLWKGLVKLEWRHQKKDWKMCF